MEMQLRSAIEKAGADIGIVLADGPSPRALADHGAGSELPAETDPGLHRQPQCGPEVLQCRRFLV